MQDKPSIRPSTTVQHIKLNLHAQTTNLSLTDVWGHAATYIYIYITADSTVSYLFMN